MRSRLAMEQLEQRPSRRYDYRRVTHPLCDDQRRGRWSWVLLFDERVDFIVRLAEQEGMALPGAIVDEPWSHYRGDHTWADGGLLICWINRVIDARIARSGEPVLSMWPGPERARPQI